MPRIPGTTVSTTASTPQGPTRSGSALSVEERRECSRSYFCYGSGVPHFYNQGHHDRKTSTDDGYSAMECRPDLGVRERRHPSSRHVAKYGFNEISDDDTISIVSTVLQTREPWSTLVRVLCRRLNLQSSKKEYTDHGCTFPSCKLQREHYTNRECQNDQVNQDLANAGRHPENIVIKAIDRIRKRACPGI